MDPWSLQQLENVESNFKSWRLGPSGCNFIEHEYTPVANAQEVELTSIDWVPITSESIGMRQWVYVDVIMAERSIRSGKMVAEVY